MAGAHPGPACVMPHGPVARFPPHIFPHWKPRCLRKREAWPGGRGARRPQKQKFPGHECPKTVGTTLYPTCEVTTSQKYKSRGELKVKDEKHRERMK